MELLELFGAWVLITCGTYGFGLIAANLINKFVGGN